MPCVVNAKESRVPAVANFQEARLCIITFVCIYYCVMVSALQ